MTDQPRTRRIPASHLRRIFNERRLTEAVEAGELTIQMKRDRHPSPPRADEPICTRSQAIAYLDAEGRTVAVVHQFTRQDGSIGASGRPDPKLLLHEGEILLPE